MIPVVVILHHQDPTPMLDATRGTRERVFVIDRSPEIEIPLDECVITVRNNEGDGFLAGRMRNLGIAKALELWPNAQGVLCFDGDRIPNIVPTVIPGDCILYCGEIDVEREDLSEDITDKCRHPYSPFYSAGLYLSARVLNALGANVFDPAFDGQWGWEDGYLGDRIVSAGYRIYLRKDLRVAGNLCEPDWVRTADITDARFRNWHMRLKMRKELPGLIQEEEVLMQEQQKQMIGMPIAEFDKLVDAITCLPYMTAKPLVEIIEKHAVKIDVAGGAHADSN